MKAEESGRERGKKRQLNSLSVNVGRKRKGKDGRISSRKRYRRFRMDDDSDAILKTNREIWEIKRRFILPKSLYVGISKVRPAPLYSNR